MRSRFIAAAAALAAIAAPLAAAGTAPKARPSAFDYKPTDKDERGLWMQMEEEERDLKTSPFLIHDADLHAYVRGVLCRTVGDEACRSVRIYLIRSPYFNAAMAPNGMMHVYSGLLLRMRSEAELAAVLAHEFGHFEQQHSLKQFRDLRAKTNAMTWFSFVPYVGLLGQLAVVGSVFTFSQGMEKEADLASIDYLVGGGYQPAAASGIWTQLRAEMDATAAARQQKSRKDKNGGFFATHPNSADRMNYLAAEAKKKSSAASRVGDAEYRAAMSKWWPQFIDDQIKLNDFGGTEFLLKQLSEGGWTGDLLYARAELLRARGNAADFTLAAELYEKSIAAGSAEGAKPLAENWRGLGLAKLRSGAQADGRAALKKYLDSRPDAADRAMIAMLAGE